MSSNNTNNFNYLFYGFLILLSLLLVLFCFFKIDHTSVPSPHDVVRSAVSHAKPEKEMHLVVLGVVQDAGYPQANCKKSCCKEVWKDKSRRKMVSCLGVRDTKSKKVYLFDATPDLKDQMHILKYHGDLEYSLSGLFLTHAHIGHYTGLIHLGREAMNAQLVPTYLMPLMSDFLNNNGPWNLLINAKNLDLRHLSHNKKVELSPELSVTPLIVPHRDEFSETVGFVISGPNKKVLFIPDIDKWEKWSEDINKWIAQVDYAFLDGTFYRNGEIWGRDMSQIPHPFISESMQRFEKLSAKDKAKVYFIHLNHTNPLLDESSEEYAAFSQSGFNLASEMQTVEL